jgi:capsular exopolysaccharide synthesis family protein
MQSNPDLIIEELNFQKYFLVLKRRWLPTTITFSTVVALALLAAVTRKPVYEADGQVLIQSDRSAKLANLGDIDNRLGEIDLLTQTSDPLSTEAEILRSRPIVQQTIKELKLTQKEGKLSTLLNFFNPDKEKKSKFIKPESFWQNLKVKPNKGTDLLTVSYKDGDPETASAVVNKVIELYKQNDTLSHRAEAVAAREFIAKQIPQVEKNAHQAERELRLFKNKYQLADLSRETGKIIDYVKALENEIDRVSVELDDISARSEKLRNQIGMDLEQAKTFISLSQSAGIQGILKELQDVRVRLADERNVFADNTPQITSLKEKEAELSNLLKQQIGKTLNEKNLKALDNINLLNFGTLRQQQITEFVNLEVQRSGLSKKLAGLQKTLTARKQALNALPQLEEQQRELEQKAKAAQSTYQTLLNRLQETQVVENQNIGNVRIVSRATVPDEPSAPNRSLILAAGVFTGACLSVAVAFLIDLMDKSVKTIEEAENIFGHTFQGIIPDFKKAAKTQGNFLQGSEQNSQLAVANNAPITPVMDAFQVLQANLKLFNTTDAKRIFAVTSSVPQEGKSSVSANLAVAIAQVGHRVLLVDADMRRPRQHQIWKLPNPLGLSDVLTGEIQIQQAIQQVTPNLSVLAAGTIPPNPVVLIESQRMRQLIATLSNNYDYIIFDTPPLAGMADTTLLGRMIDGVLMVVRPDVLDSASAIAAKKLLLNTNQNILGMVANCVDSKKELYKTGYFYQPEQRYQNQA